MYCFEDQDIEEVARNLADNKVRRLPVMNREKRLVGILSLGDMARKPNGTDPAGDALKAVSEPGGGIRRAPRISAPYFGRAPAAAGMASVTSAA